MVRSLQRTGAVARAKSCEAAASAPSVSPLLGSALKPSARTCSRYSPAGRFLTAYRPWLSVSTLTVIFRAPWRACTNAARTGAPSGPFTVPVIVAASSVDENAPRTKKAMTPRNEPRNEPRSEPRREPRHEPRHLPRNEKAGAHDRMTLPRAFVLGDDFERRRDVVVRHSAPVAARCQRRDRAKFDVMFLA